MDPSTTLKGMQHISTQEWKQLDNVKMGYRVEPQCEGRKLTKFQNHVMQQEIGTRLKLICNCTGIDVDDGDEFTWNGKVGKCFVVVFSAVYVNNLLFFVLKIYMKSSFTPVKFMFITTVISLNGGGGICLFETYSLFPLSVVKD